MAKIPFLIEVAPLTVLPFQKTVFSYRFSKNISRGEVVTVPLSGRSILGVVLESRKGEPKETEKLKEVTSLEGRKLSEKQLALGEAVSTLTFTPLGKVLKHFLPKKAGVRAAKKKKISLAKFSLSKSEREKGRKALRALEKAEEAFFRLSPDAKDLPVLWFLVTELLKKAGERGQILILVPDIAAAVRLEKYFELFADSKELVSLYHTKTAGQYYQDWSAVETGEAKIVIATRGGCFAPFQKLSAILQLDPSEESYKQWDMSPRYQTAEVLPILQQLWQAKILGVGTVPPLRILKNKVPYTESTPANLAKPEWVNLKIERFQKNWSAFSGPLQTAIQEALSKKEQVLLYVHQGGLESFSVCMECRTIFRCPSCNAPLKLTLSDHYHCKHCGFQSQLFPKCPSCHGIHFKSVGYGTEKVGREARKMFPGALVTLADKEHLGDHKKIYKFLEATEQTEPDILIVTASYLRFPPLSRLSTVAIIDADILLNLPGYRKDEQFVELVEKARLLAYPKGRILVQSFRPESDLFEKIEKLSLTEILTGFLEEREALRYPPFFRALVLERRPKLKNGEALFKKAVKEAKDLISKNKALQKTVLFQTAERKERGQTIKYALFRYLPPAPEVLREFLEKKADTIFIDHDPLRIP